MRAEFEINILLVDDQPKNLLALEAVLESPQYRLVKAASGPEALKALLREDFAVILLDVMMPGMDGFETAEVIRSRDRSRYIPIIFVTAQGTSDADVARGYGVGAVDYLFKPILPQVLRSKVVAFAELFRKTEEVRRRDQQLRELQRRQHEAQLAEARGRLETERMRHEMALAREIQQHLFPRKPPVQQGLDIAGRSVPTNAAGGDYFDYIDHPEGFLDIVIGDVSGHGVGPALLMAATRAYLRAFAPLHAEPGKVLARMNRALASDIIGDYFVTLLLMRISAHRSSFVYANAGHNPACLLNRQGEVKAQLTSTGLPLGIIPDTEFETSPPIGLCDGDIAFLYTDGVVEASAPDETLFGLERALELVRSRRHDAPSEIVAEVQSAIARFTRRETQQDDVTTVIVRAGAPG